MNNDNFEDPVFDDVDTEVVQPAAEAKAELQTNGKDRPAAPIALNDRGGLAPSDSSELWREANLALESRALPQSFKNVPQVLMGFQFLRAHGIDPYLGIAKTAIINGSLSIWGEMPKALVDRSGLMVDFGESWFDKDFQIICFENKNIQQVPWGAKCMVERAGRRPIERWFTQEDAIRAGLWKKAGPWTQYPQRMLQMRARSLALKDAFPDVLYGIAIAEYDFDLLPSAGGQGVQTEKPVDELSREYLGEATAETRSQATG